MADDLIRVVVVDDHTLMRQGLIGLLESEADINVVGQAGDAVSARKEIDRTGPDLVLMDVGLPGMSGIDLTAELTSNSPDLRVLIVTMHERDDYLFRALKAGAGGYVLKDVEVGDLLTAVRSVARGATYVSQSLTGKLVSDYLNRSANTPENAKLGGLTKREREVVALIAEDMTTTQIADKLFLSPHTVQTHRDHIMTKLDLHSRVELTKYAIRKGIIHLDP